MDQEQLRWWKSSYSGGNGGGCIEVADTATKGRAVRDSVLGDASPVLGPFNADDWRHFVALAMKR